MTEDKTMEKIILKGEAIQVRGQFTEDVDRPTVATVEQHGIVVLADQVRETAKLLKPSNAWRFELTTRMLTGSIKWYEDEDALENGEEMHVEYCDDKWGALSIRAEVDDVDEATYVLVAEYHDTYLELTIPLV